MDRLYYRRQLRVAVVSPACSPTKEPSSPPTSLVQSSLEVLQHLHLLKVFFKAPSELNVSLFV